MSQFGSKNGLIQVVADNIQISSQNGQKSTHGLAMIITQSRQTTAQHVNSSLEILTIKRLKLEGTKAANLTPDDVAVQRYHGNKQPDMIDVYGIMVVPTMAIIVSQRVSLNTVYREDFTFIMDVTGRNKCSEYGRYNTKRARESGRQSRTKTGIAYVPFLDMAPAEPDTIKTAMVRAQSLTSLAGQEWTIFTNDQQLYQVTVHVIWTNKHLFARFIPRLGGMHMIMCFVGSVGFLMAGSGL